MVKHDNSITGSRGYWIGSHEKTFLRTAAAWSPYFSLTWIPRLDQLKNECADRTTPGVFVVLELSEADAQTPSTTSIELWNRSVTELNSLLNKPVSVCIGHLVPAQVAVDWIQDGVFTYLERAATVERFRQMFGDCHKRVTHVTQQFQRFDLLLQRWNSVTDREAMVLEMLLEGTPNKTIATRLGVSQRTVETRRHNLYGKLDSRCVAEVVKVIYELDILAKVFCRVDDRSSQSVPKPTFLQASMRPIPAITRDVAPAFSAVAN